MKVYGVVKLDQVQGGLWSRGTRVSTVMGCAPPHYLFPRRIVM